MNAIHSTTLAGQYYHPLEFKLNDARCKVPEQQLLADLKETATRAGRNTLTAREYDELGKYHSRRLKKRLGSWNKALLKAGLEIQLPRNISERELFENIENVWIRLGRQPAQKEMRRPFSRYSPHPYLDRFGTWRDALLAFIDFINKRQGRVVTETAGESKITYKHKTKRHPSERLKVQVLMRDGNKCRLCGATVTGDNIHFDHILPWCKGGETVLENLQVLCKKHNLAKGDLV